MRAIRAPTTRLLPVLSLAGCHDDSSPQPATPTHRASPG